MVQRAEQPSTDQAGDESDRCDQGGDGADAGSLPVLRLPILSALSSPLSFSASTAMASPAAAPESFRSPAATSADASVLKIAKTTVSLDMCMSPCFV